MLNDAAGPFVLARHLSIVEPELRSTPVLRKPVIDYSELWRVLGAVLASARR